MSLRTYGIEPNWLEHDLGTDRAYWKGRNQGRPKGSAKGAGEWTKVETLEGMWRVRGKDCFGVEFDREFREEGEADFFLGKMGSERMAAFVPHY